MASVCDTNCNLNFDMTGGGTRPPGGGGLSGLNSGQIISDSLALQVFKLLI